MANFELKLNLEESQIDFLKKYDLYGFPDESELVKTALNYLQNQLNEKKLIDEQKDSKNDDHPDPFIDGLFSGSPTLSIKYKEILYNDYEPKI